MNDLCLKCKIWSLPTYSVSGSPNFMGARGGEAVWHG